MKRICMTFGVALALCAGASMAEASITSWSLAAEEGGAIAIGMPTLTEITSAEYRLETDAMQSGSPAYLYGDFATDSEPDPTVWLVQSVENDTDFTWTDYHIDLGMNQTFTIVGVVAPPDWTWVITQPVAGQEIPCCGTTGWVGSVDFYAGTPIPIGGSGDFGVVFSFTGSVEYCTQQVPTPEPASLFLLTVAIVAGMSRRP